MSLREFLAELKTLGSCDKADLLRALEHFVGASDLDLYRTLIAHH